MYNKHITGLCKQGFVKNMPVSVNITGRAKEDSLVLNMANKLESVLGYKGQVSRHDK